MDVVEPVSFDLKDAVEDTLMLKALITSYSQEENHVTKAKYLKDASEIADKFRKSCISKALELENG